MSLGAHSGIEPGPLVQESNALTIVLQRYSLPKLTLD